MQTAEDSSAPGPATEEHVHSWPGNGLSAGRRRLTTWFAGLRDRLATVDVEGGGTAYVLAEDADDLARTPPSDAVRLLPGHDPRVLGPGTKDPHVVPPAHRTPVTRKAYPVVAGGVVSGTWKAGPDTVAVTWFASRGAVPREAVDEQVGRLAGLLGRPLRAAVTVT